MPEFESCSESRSEIVSVLIVRVLLDDLVGRKNNNSWNRPGGQSRPSFELNRFDKACFRAVSEVCRIDGYTDFDGKTEVTKRSGE